MINVTDFDQRVADHVNRIDRVNRDFWTRAATDNWVTRTLRISTGIASSRQRMGAAVVRTGERLQGTTVRHATDPSAV